MATKKYDSYKERNTNFAFVRRTQNKLYMQELEAKIDSMLEDRSFKYYGYNVWDEIEKVLREAFYHQKLENRPLPTKLLLKVNEEFNRRNGFDYSRGDRIKIDPALRIENPIQKYSAVARVRNKQKQFNGKMHDKIEDVFRYRTGLERLYLQELKEARAENRKPHAFILEAIKKRRSELLDWSSSVINRLSIKPEKQWTERDVKSYDEAQRINRVLSILTIKDAKSYSWNPLTRNKELDNQIKIVEFKRDYECEKNSWSSSKQEIAKEIDDELLKVGKKDGEYKEYLEALKEEMVPKVEAEKEEYKRLKKQLDDHFSKREQDMYVSLHGKPGETYADVIAREEKERELAKEKAAKESAQAYQDKKDYGDSIFGVERAKRLAERTYAADKYGHTDNY